MDAYLNLIPSSPNNQVNACLVLLQIETKYDAPGVGQNIQDHLAVFLGPFLVDKPVTMLFERDVNSEAFTDFMDYGTGPLSSAGTVATAMISSSFAGEGDWPDLQFILVGTAVYSNYDLDFSNGFNVRRDILKKYMKSAKGRDSFQIVVSGQRPIQRGEIYLKSNNPRDPPVIDPKYLHNTQDLEVIVEGELSKLKLRTNKYVNNELCNFFQVSKKPCNLWKTQQFSNPLGHDLQLKFSQDAKVSSFERMIIGDVLFVSSV